MQFWDFVIRHNLVQFELRDILVHVTTISAPDQVPKFELAQNVKTHDPNTLPSIHWDTVHLDYPVRKFPSAEISSETIGKQWRSHQQMLKKVREPIEEIQHYFQDYNVTKELTRSQTATDFGIKVSETERFIKHGSVNKNQYIYPPIRKLAERTPQSSAHGKTETQSSYVVLRKPALLITNKDLSHQSVSSSLDSLPVDVTCRNIEPIDTTHEGFEKYLDPYLTTNRLYHRPYTADQLQRVSCSKDVETYYTFANTPLTRTPSRNCDQWYLPHKRSNSMYDREKYKSDFRDIRPHNALPFVPGTFNTASKQNYSLPHSAPASKLHSYEEDIKSYYLHMVADLLCNSEQETSNIRNKYITENSRYGSKKPLCYLFDPFVEKNRRLKK